MCTERMNQVGNKINPWPGLSSYKDPATITKVPFVFCGRDKEKKDLYDLINCNILMTLYGKSGLGKTSLLNAGVFPLLRANQYFPINIRLGVLPENKVIQETIIEIIETNLRKMGGDIQELSAVIKEYDLTRPKISSSDYLWTYFASHKFLDSKGNDLNIVLAFDQFEEILFSRSNDALLLLQQILYMMNDNNNLPSFEEEGVTYNYTTNFRFILSIREDNLFMLEDVIDNNYLQAMKKNRYRLKEITLEGAKDVVKIPGQGCIDKKNEDAIVDKIIHEAQDDDGTISSLMISFLCNRLFAQVQDKGGIITLKQIEENGSETLEKFCSQQLSLLPDKEFELFTKHLITEDGRRKIIDISTFSKDVPSGKFLLEEKTRLLHTFKISTNKEKQVEIIHDRFSAIVLAIKEDITEKKKTEESLRAYEQEQKRLEAEREEKRTFKNQEYNRHKRLSSLNVLTQKGRRIIDNCLDFGEMQCIHKRIGRNCFDSILSMQFVLRNVADNIFKEDVYEGGTQEIFRDPLLENATYRISFLKNGSRRATTDGVYGVSLKYKHNCISEIMFYGKNIKDGNVDYDTPVFIYGGYCGIRIDYDRQNREIGRTYLGIDGLPTKCMDGYTTIEYTLNDDGLPIETRFFDIKNEKVPCINVFGNHGYKSKFDKNWNEVERMFIDIEGNPIKIVSGVYGKKLKYDSETFLLQELSNIDCNGDFMQDCDGYVTVKYCYDEENRKNRELYYDANDNVWKNPDGIYGLSSHYNISNWEIIDYNLDSSGNVTEDINGKCCTVVTFNAMHQLTNLKTYNSENTLQEDEDGWAEQRYSYDALNRLNQIKVFDSYGNFIKGFILDFDKFGIKVKRIWNVDSNGELILHPDFGDETHQVYGVEFIECSDNDLPLYLMRFVNRNSQYIMCSDGYYGVGRWENSDGRTVKELFFDLENKPTCDNNGVYGHMFEYIDKETEKIINVNEAMSPIEDIKGICYQLSSVCSNFESLYYYDINNQPALGNGFWGITIKTDKKNNLTIKQTRILGVDGETIDGTYKEEIYDAFNRPIKQCYRDSHNFVVCDENNDYIFTKDYSDNGLTIITTHKDPNEVPCNCAAGYCSIREIYENQGRLIEQVFYDVEGNPVQSDSGSYGFRREYSEEGNKKTIYLGKAGNPSNNSEGVAFLYESFDNKGRILSQRKANLVGELVGGNEYFVREFVDIDSKNCAYYVHWLNSKNELSPVGACYYRYQEEDAYGRVVKRFSFDKNRQPVCDDDGDYGETIKYDVDAHIQVVTFLDKDGNPHNNRKGYSSTKRWFDDEDRVIKELYFTVESKPCMIGNESYGFIYKYLPNGSKITGFLDEYGNVHNNDEGYAYKEELSLGNSSEEYYYDSNLQCIIPKSDDLGDYGKRRIQTEDELFIISLDDSGSPHINKKGYIARSVVTMEDGTVILRYLDKNFHPIMDDYGDYATAIEISDDGLLRKEYSLDKNSNQHNNLYGFACSVRTTDYSGREILLWYDNAGNQVVSRKSRKVYILKLKRIIKEWLYKNSANQFTFNARQIGATHSVVLVRQELGGLAKKQGLKGMFVLFGLMDWNFYDDMNKLSEIIPLVKDNEKDLVLLPITLDGPNLLQVGDVIKVNLPKGKLGFRFVEWNVNQQTYSIMQEKLNLFLDTMK